MMRERTVRVGVVGAGALGTLFGWHLAAVGEVTFLDIREDAIAAINRAGIRVDRGTEEGAVRAARATARATDIFDSDIIFVFVKARDTLRALRPFAGQLNPSTAIVSLQNGIGNEEAIKTALGGTVALAIGATSEAATALGDGHSRRIGEGLTVLGSAGAAAPTLERITTMLAAAGLAARSVYDIRPHLWGKLIANAAINPVSALLGADNGVILSDEDAGSVARAVAVETAAVAAALRVTLLFADPWIYVRDVAQQTADARNSMAIDLAARRRTEIEQINGAIAATGRRIGVPTPVNETMTRLIKARERLNS